jgi:hypothetical protein
MKAPALSLWGSEFQMAYKGKYYPDPALDSYQLKKLIIDAAYITLPYVEFFKSFGPIGAQEATGLNWSSEEHPISGVLCPNLESLHIEDTSIIEQSVLIPVLNDIVTLHAVAGCLLKSFTIYKNGRKWEQTGGWKFHY